MNRVVWTVKPNHSPVKHTHAKLNILYEVQIGEITMKLSEDWLSVILAFALMILAMIGLINPAWVKF